MSFREKRAWIVLVTYAAVFGGYFFLLSQAWDEAYARGLTIGLTVGAIVVLVIVAVVLNIALALLAPKEANAPADERETMIDLKSERISSYVQSAGVVCLIGALLVGWNAILVAVLLQASLVIAELAKAGTQIAYFRRGA
ncbi:MAG: hypothetical protein NT015_14520 [Alphaproteobacteria bacterium]|nr:hypothetical protein [Alphaproteobacteria bacterium]